VQVVEVVVRHEDLLEVEHAARREVLAQQRAEALRRLDRAAVLAPAGRQRARRRRDEQEGPRGLGAGREIAVRGDDRLGVVAVALQHVVRAERDQHDVRPLRVEQLPELRLAGEEHLRRQVRPPVPHRGRARRRQVDQLHRRPEELGELLAPAAAVREAPATGELPVRVRVGIAEAREDDAPVAVDVGSGDRRRGGRGTFGSRDGERQEEDHQLSHALRAHRAIDS
jgi:hypothetical protein